MLENLNRIFGACFPPLVILGWLGAGIFLYTAFRSGEWRKKLTGAEGFLALLLFFMMANRIPNPAIISFRYVIGIGILTLFWSVWLLRWSWHNCPAPLRRWRGMLLLALVFGICLGGFLKEIRLSKRTKMETEAIRYFHSLSPESLTDSIIITQEERFSRIIRTAGHRSAILQLPSATEFWSKCIYLTQSHYQHILLFLPWNDKEMEQNKRLLALSGFRVIPKHTGKYFRIFSITSPETSVTAAPNTNVVLKEHFNQLREISITDPLLQNLQKRGVHFAQKALCFPIGWQPNDGHGYDCGDLKKLELKVVPNNSTGNSICFSGWSKGTVITQKRFMADKQYWLSLQFRGTISSRLGIYLYCYDKNDIFLKVEPVGYFYGTSIDSVQNAVLFIEQFPSKTAKFILALELADGYLLLDHISLTKIL